MTTSPTAPSLEEFKSRLPLVDIVARRVRLVRRGREHTGLCPFHKEKSPSFTVSEDKGFYHCFGCGAHGNAIDFVMALDGLDFAAALERLAEMTGIPAPRRAGPEAPRVDRTLYDANAAAVAFLERRLWSEGGHEARAYLERRGLDAATARRFKLGYAPLERTALKAALMAQGFTERQLVAAGLIAVAEDSRESFDRFRHRLMFPIEDARGRPVGFGGRALGEAKAKYLNTADTELFHKGSLLYNLAAATRSAREAGTLVVAEGYMDVIALVRAGIEGAVAPLGTAITEAQLEAAWKVAAEPLLCLDGDDAGLRAARRAAERALPLLRAGRSLRIALLPAGEDPDSLLAARGPEALRDALAKPLALVDFLWRSEHSAAPIDTPERRADLARRLRDLVRRVGDMEVRRHYGAAFRERLQTLWPSRRPSGPTPYRGTRSGSERGFERSPEPASVALRAADPLLAHQRRLLGPVLRDPELLVEAEEDLAAIELPDRRLDQLRVEMLSWYAQGGDLDATALRNHLSRYGFAGLVDQLLADSPFVAAALAERLDAEARRHWRASLLAFRVGGARRALAGDRSTEGEDHGSRLGGLDRLLNTRNDDADHAALNHDVAID